MRRLRFRGDLHKLPSGEFRLCFVVDMLLAWPVSVALNVPDKLERQKVVNCGWDPRFGDQRILKCFQVTCISWSPPWPLGRLTWRGRAI